MLEESDEGRGWGRHCCSLPNHVGGEGEGCVRDCASFEKEGVLSKRNLGAFKGTSLLGSGVESPLIFYTPKKKF